MPATIHVIATDKDGRKVEVQIEAHPNQYAGSVKEDAIELLEAAAKKVGLGNDSKPTTSTIH